MSFLPTSGPAFDELFQFWLEEQRKHGGKFMPLLCKDCEYITSLRDDLDQGGQTSSVPPRCVHPNNINLVTGEINPIDCGILRQGVRYCGPAGKWFLKRKVKDTIE